MQFHWRWYKAKHIVGIYSKGFLGKLCVDVWLRLRIYQPRTFHWQTLNFATRLRNKKVLWIMQHYTKNEWMSILWVTGIASSYFWTFVFRNIIYHITLVGQLRPPSNTLFKRMIALETRMHAIPLGIRSNLSVRSLFWKGNQIDFVHVILYCSWNAIICTLRRWDQWLRLFSWSNYPCRLSN
jgi:hypothetical protein